MLTQRRDCFVVFLKEPIAMAKIPKVGSHVEWDTPQGKTTGVVTKKITGRANVGGHVAHASTSDPQLQVQSDKSGKTAIHKPRALKSKQAR